MPSRAPADEPGPDGSDSAAAIRREKTEGLTCCSGHGAEVAVVEGRERARHERLGEQDDRCVGETQSEVAVPLAELSRPLESPAVGRVDGEGVHEVVEVRQLGVDAET